MYAGRFLNNRGKASLSTLVWILILAVAGYAAYKFAPPYVSHYMLKTEVENEAKVAHMYTDDLIVKHILKKAVSWRVPIEVEDIYVERSGSYINVSIDYIDVVDLVGGYTKELQFSIRVEEPLKETAGAFK